MVSHYSFFIGEILVKLHQKKKEAKIIGEILLKIIFFIKKEKENQVIKNIFNHHYYE